MGDADSRDGDFGSDFASDGADDGGMMMSDDDDDYDDRGSCFTGYTMTSSKMRRNEQLQMLDAKLEVEIKRFMSDHADEDENMTWEDLEQRGITTELFPERKMEKGELNKEMIMAKFEYERDHDEDLVYVYKKVPRVKHDCV